MPMLYDRSSQILLLKKEFSKLKSWGFRPTVFTIPVSSIFGRSDCVIEITIPREYPVKRVSFKLLNPIPHKWADGDSIVCPRDLYDKPLVDIVSEVFSNFNDYDKYVSGKRLHEDDKSTEPKYIESFTKLQQEIVHSINDHPKTVLSHVNSLSDDRIREVLESDSEVYKLIYRCERLSDLVKDTKKRLNSDEEMLSESIRNAKKTENLFSDLKENIQQIDKITNKSPFKFTLDPKDTIRKCLKREISSIHNKINRRKDLLHSGKKIHKELKDDLFKLYYKINLLQTFYIALEKD